MESSACRLIPRRWGFDYVDDDETEYTTSDQCHRCGDGARGLRGSLRRGSCNTVPLRQCGREDGGLSAGFRILNDLSPRRRWWLRCISKPSRVEGPAKASFLFRNIQGELFAVFEQLLHAGGAGGFAINADDGFRAGGAEHQPAVVLGNVFHTVEIFRRGQRHAQ